MGNRQRSKSTAGRPRQASRPPRAEPSTGNQTSHALPAVLPGELTLSGEEFSTRRTTSVTRPPRPEGEARPCLVVLSGRGEGRLIRLEQPDSVTLGRSRECDVQLDDDGVSRKHARILVGLDKQVMIEDLGSRNGTFVGESRVDRCPLQTGDILRLGSATVLKFAWLDASEEELHERMKAAALRDGLTGVYNRRHFDECLATERASAERHRHPLSLIVLDLDDFKRINDTHGHPAGDAVLRDAAAALLRCARREDLVFRFGGEEFAVLARDTTLEGARPFAERLREEIARAEIALPGGPSVRVTASLGVAQLRPREREADFLTRADTAMYEAKRAGKNRVAVSERKLSPAA